MGEVESKALVVMMTEYQNQEYWEIAWNHLLNNNRYEVILIDYTDPGKENSRTVLPMAPNANALIWSMGRGFCSNINTGIGLLIQNNRRQWYRGVNPPVRYDYLCHINDDVKIPPYFIEDAMKFLNDYDCFGLVCGVQQDSEDSQLSIDEFREGAIPDKKMKSKEFNDLAGKWGDFSAWMIKAEVIEKVGIMDEFFDHSVGIIGDNDYLLRIRKVGYQTRRSWKLPFFHAKGISQRRHRPNFPYDVEGKRGRWYFKLKWGIDPYTPGATDKDTYDKPFDGKGMRIIDKNNLMIDGVVHSFEGALK